MMDYSRLLTDVYTTDGCCLCATPPVHTSLLGMPWCADHQHRASLLDWGLTHNCPPLDTRPYGGRYTLLGEPYHWYIASVLGNDEYVWMLLAAIETEYGALAA